ncbi:hypothetical protein HanRHA438_Chr04g0173641 [Helianthus annuus]|uniref:Uncharacterized protein n=1 Tax=Helianthus annuus TaxID=4232 RepID=A0A251VC10_HELAN|nr:hypothetical protein HanXRQr2_Chr04g0163911 [Helianthus annuus]KAJ0580895.1 hypothetical protein HanHA300_Chr04g0134631 [Helianthus annuus]KAJ0588623.1 hypothetical protein HanIR_Chr04g0176801 [Helianthus annuus]KAJ0596834.1 hypothetical protein HanHA89_Chr04g0147491 [Helianthus annuus]KAJ0757513.1 hypothetical protein HanLR1_Chr04g0139601 [Helianthus annuus]
MDKNVAFFKFLRRHTKGHDLFSCFSSPLLILPFFKEDLMIYSVYLIMECVIDGLIECSFNF